MSGATNLSLQKDLIDLKHEILRCAICCAQITVYNYRHQNGSMHRQLFEARKSAFQRLKNNAGAAVRTQNEVTPLRELVRTKINKHEHASWGHSRADGCPVMAKPNDVIFRNLTGEICRTRTKYIALQSMVCLCSGLLWQIVSPFHPYTRTPPSHLPGSLTRTISERLHMLSMPRMCGSIFLCRVFEPGSWHSSLRRKCDQEKARACWPSVQVTGTHFRRLD